MLRILDRQRYWSFFKAYVISFVSLVGLYIVIDAFTNLDEFTKIKTGVGELFQHMGHYYLVRISFFYDRLCGVITMLAAIFTVTWMQKNNELLAMLAAGISSKRAIRPVIVSAALVSILAVMNQELIIPQISDDLQRTPDDDGDRPVKAGSRWDFNELQLQGENGHRAERTIEPFHALLPVSRFGTLLALDARLARYIPDDDPRSPLRGGWLLWQATLSPAGAKPDGTLLIAVEPEMVGKLPKHYGDGPPPPGDMMFLRSDITFTNIIRSADWYQFATTPDLVRAYADQGNRTERLNVAVYLHGRLVRPITSMVLLLLSLPLVLGGEGRNMFINLGLSLGTSALFYGVNFLMGYLGGNNVMPPELAAWVPIIAFGSLAAARWDNIRT
jgi:lipopolysaccharide export system permease protein